VQLRLGPFERDAAAARREARRASASSRFRTASRRRGGTACFTAATTASVPVVRARRLEGPAFPISTSASACVEPRLTRFLSRRRVDGVEDDALKF